MSNSLIEQEVKDIGESTDLSVKLKELKDKLNYFRAYKGGKFSPEDLEYYNMLPSLILGLKAAIKNKKPKTYTEKEVEELLLTQRGNCYVAILTKTRDEKIAKIASSAPEPSGGKWRKS